MIRTLTLFAAFSPLAGCIFNFGPGVDCDASAAASVSVVVSASDAGDVSGAVVSFTPRGEPPRACDGFGSEYVCGWEVPGRISVRVEAPGYARFQETVFVEQGECHVIQETVHAVLEPVECDDLAVPAVLATVVGASGEELSDVAVRWGRADSDMVPMPCEDLGKGTWGCAEEMSGDLDIYAEAAGHAGQMLTVHVDADACHPITENVAFELEWLED